MEVREIHRLLRDEGWEQSVQSEVTGNISIDQADLVAHGEEGLI